MTGRLRDHRHEGPRCPFCTDVGRLLKAQDIAAQWIVVLETFELLGKETFPEPALTQALVDAGVPRDAVPTILDRLLARRFTTTRLGPLSKEGAAMLAKIREAASRPPSGPPGGD
jgi:hypothetical protein